MTATLAVLLASLSSVGAAFLKFWTVLTLVGLLLYLALSVFISQKPTWLGVRAVACVTAALAVLLVVEEGSNDSRVDVANMTLAGCVYLLLTKHKIALGIAVFALAGGVVGAYYIISSLVRVEYQGTRWSSSCRAKQFITWNFIRYGCEKTGDRTRDQTAL